MDARQIRTSRGFTLIEVMIAMLIGIIGIVVMMQTFAVSEGFKRTSTAGTDAQVNGSVALYMLEREIRTSGYGMNGYLPAIGLGTSYCDSVRVYDSATGTAKDVRILPFEINPAGIPAGDANTDVIVIGFGTSDSVVAGVQADQASNIAPFNVLSAKDGFRTGDLVVSVQPATPSYTATSCVLHELTQVPGAAGACGTPSAGSDLIHAVGGYKSANAACATVNSKYNSASGIKDASNANVPPVKVATGGQIFNLGIPSLRAYAIRGGNLTMCSILTQDCSSAANFSVVVNDIVSMRAVYGRDTTATQDFSVDVWDRTPLPSLADSARVMGVMLQLTARSGLKEKPSSGTVCDASTNPNRPDKTQDWIGNGVAGAGIDLSTSLPGNEWRCYRYRLYQTRVPIRNMYWRP